LYYNKYASLKFQINQFFIYNKQELDSKHKFFDDCKKKHDKEVLSNIQKKQEYNKKKEEDILNIFVN